MFEHILNRHAFEILADPVKLAKLANLDPEMRRELAGELGQSIVRKIYGKVH